MADNTESKSIVIECDCGTHMLKVMSEVDYHNDTNSGKVRFHQDIYLAMFSYGNQKRNFFARCKIAWKYLRSGKMFSDQLCLSPEEATKLSDFLNENIIQAQPITPDEDGE